MGQGVIHYEAHQVLLKAQAKIPSIGEIIDQLCSLICSYWGINEKRSSPN